EKLHLTGTQGTTLTFTAAPGQEEADQLPHGIQAQASRHHRVALKMHFEKPEIRVDVQFGHQAAFAVFAVIGSDVGNTVDHQHFVDGQAHGAGEQLAVATADQVFFVKVIRIHV